MVAKSKGTMIRVGNVKTKKSSKVDVLNTWKAQYPHGVS